ncbi:MAG: FHA domain-containing protein [Bdellovibrionales bacterium]
MALKLKVLNGPLKGQEFTLAPGFGIGRSKGDVRLDDAKASSLHAFVVETEGRLVLMDNGSKNGLRLHGERVMQITLKDGISFQIGNTDFTVVKEAVKAKSVPTPPPQPKAKIKAAEPQPGDAVLGAPEWTLTANPVVDPVVRQEDRWNHLLASFIEEVLHELKDQPKAVAPLHPAVRLNFIGGLQAETVWTLGYGPRRAGAQSVDLPIFEPGAPEVCFEIIPSPEGVTFRTNHPKEVTVNGQPTRVKPLEAGDTIAVGATRIEVELVL